MDFFHNRVKGSFYVLFVLLTFCMTSTIHAQSVEPDSGLLGKADSLFRAERYADAIKEYENAPTSAEVLKKIGISYIKLWNMPAAIRSLRNARQRAPQDLEIEAHLAEALSWNKEFDEAIQLFKDVLSKGSTKTEIRFGYARVLAWAKDYDAAIDQYSQILSTDSTQFQSRMGLAQTISWKKQFHEAIEEYERAAKLTTDPKEKSQATSRLAQVLSWQGEFDTAIIRYKEAFQSNSKNTDALFGLGEICEWTGQYRLAKSYYEQILQIQPNHKAAKTKLLQLMWVQ
ncbi:MAG: tetratricopeptide repeat protein [Ignavibacteriae bacterium]|nr:tetratricopeptide repeat protein [Ignavibacteria bacterium]MBI3365944.1 tetratricopeptide repeat protein [Ignavibacteriota bacterium]